MMINEVTARAGHNRRRKRVGRGESSGMGKTSTRGNKGCQSRSGGGTRPLHEGGQMPIFRRLPKRGFSNVEFATVYQVVNLGRLDKLFSDGDTVDVDALRRGRLVSGVKPLVKILGKGELGKKLTVEAHAFSGGARTAIEKAGGNVKLIETRTPAEKARSKRNTVTGKVKRPKAASAKPSAAPKPAEAEPES